MAKISARSKGYRKTYKKVTGYTDLEKKIMIIGFSALVIILIAVLVLPDAIAKIGSLKVVDGVVQDAGENWLLANTGTSSKKIYKKLAEVAPIEGYELSETVDGITDANLRYFVYKPADGSESPELLIQSGSNEAETLITNYRSMISSYAEVLYLDEEIHEETINGMKTYSCVIEYRMEDYAEETTAETTEETEVTYTYTQSAVVYVDSNLSDKCVVITLSNEGADESVFGDRAALLTEALAAVPSITVAG